MPISPVLEGQTTYPFVRLNEAARRVEARGVDVIDFGTGDPREATDPLIRQALVDGVRERMGYPLAQGLPELREAIADWTRRRFDVVLDPDRQVIPTLGSKEAIFSLAQVVVDLDGGKDTIAYTEPGYPVYERGALFAHARPLALPLLEENGFLPELDALDVDTWSRLAAVWVNYPNNPTGAITPLSFYERLAERAREHGFVLASDEAYSELWFDEPPTSALQLDDLTNVAVFNTLSKRSSMTGYRSGFVAGDSELIAALKAFRPTVGTAPQEFVQRASVVAWGDETHVERTRELYRRKRSLFLEFFARKGVRVAGSEATMYLWLAIPRGETSESSEAFSERLLERGVLVTPGSYLGAAGEGYVRLALVPSEDDCRRAIEILEGVL
ncbi:MAG: aminotransferase class I/II-fold pyridoxal phosphate-dependent enzyme [Actinomycetota bacterium]|nr:aminotransferase class I/II-fold pyridoxal phosphate-dependent enzyme [Actinomycetota bacterium]